MQCAKTINAAFSLERKNMKNLFGEEIKGIESEWVGMPDFIQSKQRPYKELKIRFESESDYKDFAKLIGQNITPLTKSIWFPQLVRGKDNNKAYV
jgi:hypothetical protein